MTTNISFSFAGCGFMGIYHLGVATCLQRHIPHLLEGSKFAGASAGAIIACGVLCGVPLNECVDFTLRLARKAKSRTMGGFHPSININDILKKGLEQILPSNAHEICSGRLFVSVTHYFSWKNEIISEFPSRAHLIDALLMSAFVPGFSGYIPPTYKGQYCFDGGFSDNIPVLDDKTILVSPFAGECDICPRDNDPQIISLTIANTSMQCSMNNFARLCSALFPPHSTHLKDICWQGFDDALHYLSEHKLIRCNEHLLFSHLQHHERNQEVTCRNCKHHIHLAHKDKLPKQIVHVLDEYKKTESGILQRLLNSTPVKLLSWINLPWTLVLESWLASMMFCIRLLPNLPIKTKSLRDFLKTGMGLGKLMKLINMGCERFTHLSYRATLEYRLVIENVKHLEESHSLSSIATGTSSDHRSHVSDTRDVEYRTVAEKRRERKGDIGSASQKFESSFTFPVAGSHTAIPQPNAAVCQRENSAPEALTPAFNSASVYEISSPTFGATSTHSAQRLNFGLSVDIKTQGAVSFTTTSNVTVEDNSGGSKAWMKAVDEQMEIHVDRVEIEPVIRDNFAEIAEDTGEVSFPSQVMGDHDQKLDKGTETPALCPQQVDTFQACLEAFQQMEAIMTIHYLDENNEMHVETIYGVPEGSLKRDSRKVSAIATPKLFENDNTAVDTEEVAAAYLGGSSATGSVSHIASSCGSAMHSEQQSDTSDVLISCSCSTPAEQQHQCTWDSILAQDETVQHELLDIIEEKILQPERQKHQRYRAKNPRHHIDTSKACDLDNYFSLEIGGSILAEDLSRSVNLNSNGSSSDIHFNDQGSLHLIRSVSDASALAHRLQALKEGNLQQKNISGRSKRASGSQTPVNQTKNHHQLTQEAGFVEVSGSFNKPSLQRLKESYLSKSLSLSESHALDCGLSCDQNSKLAKSASDCSFLRENLQALKAGYLKNTSMSSLDLSKTETSVSTSEKRIFITESNKQSKAEEDMITCMKGKFRDGHLSRSQRAFDSSFQDDTDDSQPSSCGDVELQDEIGHGCSDNASHMSRVRSHECVSETQSSRIEFGGSVSVSMRGNKVLDSSSNVAHVRPKLRRSHSLRKSVSELESVQMSLRELKEDEDGRNPHSIYSPQEPIQSVMFCDQQQSENTSAHCLVTVDQKQVENVCSDLTGVEQSEWSKKSPPMCKPS